MIQSIYTVYIIHNVYYTFLKQLMKQLFLRNLFYFFSVRRKETKEETKFQIG